MPFTVYAPSPQPLGTPAGYLLLNLVRPAVVRLSSAASVSWPSEVLPVAKLSMVEKALATAAPMASVTVPAGATSRTMSATREPLLTPSTLVTEATRSGRTAAT